MSAATDHNMKKCANCGKGEENSDSLKACTACKLVKYCNRECQIAHRPLHKTECRRRAAELHDEALFKEHPPREDCPICLLPLPLAANQTTFKSCCGKIICCGCIYAIIEEACLKAKKKGTEEVNDLCPFCRAPTATSDAEEIERMKKLMDANNAEAFNQLAGDYECGNRGMPQDWSKANELWLKAGELGCANGYNNLGHSYYNGRGVDMDIKKAKYYWELGAMDGDVFARHNIGCIEGNAGNDNRAYKHLMLSTKAGYKYSLDVVKEGFMDGMVTKDEYASTLRAYQKRVDEMKSDDRDKVEPLASNHPV